MQRRATRWTVRAAGVLGVVLLSGCIEWEAPLRTDVATPFGSPVGAESLVVGDFDGDGFEDLAGYGWNQGLRTGYLLWSDGDGTFTQATLPGGRWPEAVGDFDGDGIDDLVLGGPVWVNNGDGSAMRLYRGGAAEGSRPRGFTDADTVDLPVAKRYGVGDFDGDGALDLVRTQTVFTYYERINPLLNDGSASFTEAPSLGVDSGPLNAGGGGYVRFRRGGRDVLFGNQPFWSPPLAGLAGSLGAVGDIDGDGDDDVAMIADGQVGFFRWTGSAWAAFPPYQELPVTVSETNRRPFMSLLDLDGDGVTDLAYADAAGSRYRSGTADGGFPYEHVGVAPATSAAFADVNGDGLPDAVTGVSGPTGIEVHLNRSTPVG